MITSDLGFDILFIGKLLIIHCRNWLKVVHSLQPDISFIFSLANLVYINEYKAQSNCNQDPTFRHSGQSRVFIGGDLKLQCGFLNTQGMTSSANKMHEKPE
jgi:hypothetical protein